MNPEIAQIEQQIKNYTISNSDELESFRLQFLSKKGSIQELFRLMGSIPNQEKAAFGKSLNELKQGMIKYPQLLLNERINKPVNPLDSKKVTACVKAAEEELTGAGRVLLRASGTEPLIRVMVEGEDINLVDKWAHEIAVNVLSEFA